MSSQPTKRIPKRKLKQMAKDTATMTDIYRWHAKRRCEERFGITLTNKQIRKIVHDIQNRKAEYLGSTSKYRSIFRVKFLDFTIRVVYSKKKKTIITVMEDWDHQQESQSEETQTQGRADTRPESGEAKEKTLG